MVFLFFGEGGEGNTEESAQHLIQSFAGCLQDSLFRPTTHAGYGAGAPKGGAEEGGGGRGRDERAHLILELLLRPIVMKHPAPNLTHLLLGFDLASSVALSSSHINIMAFSPLQVMHECLYQHRCHATWPEEVEMILQLLCQLSIDSATSSATVELLRSLDNRFFVDVLQHALTSPVGPESNHRTAFVWQIKWLLQMHASVLHQSCYDIQHHKEDAYKLISGLLSEPVDCPISFSSATSLAESKNPAAAMGGAMGGAMPQCTLLALLHFCNDAIHREKPCVKHDVYKQHLRRQMQVDTLLSAPEVVGEGGVRSLSAKGVLLYHIPTLGSFLVRYYKELEQSCGWQIDSDERRRANEVVEDTLR